MRCGCWKMWSTSNRLRHASIFPYILRAFCMSPRHADRKFSGTSPSYSVSASTSALSDVMSVPLAAPDTPPPTLPAFLPPITFTLLVFCTIALASTR